VLGAGYAFGPDGPCGPRTRFLRWLITWQKGQKKRCPRSAWVMTAYHNGACPASSAQKPTAKAPRHQEASRASCWLRPQPSHGQENERVVRTGIVSNLCSQARLRLGANHLSRTSIASLPEAYPSRIARTPLISRLV
jgi:hypothetical protein